MASVKPGTKPGEPGKGNIARTNHTTRGDKKQQTGQQGGQTSGGIKSVSDVISKFEKDNPYPTGGNWHNVIPNAPLTAEKNLKNAMAAVQREYDKKGQMMTPGTAEAIASELSKLKPGNNKYLDWFQAGRRFDAEKFAQSHPGETLRTTSTPGSSTTGTTSQGATTYTHKPPTTGPVKPPTTSLTSGSGHQGTPATTSGAISWSGGGTPSHPSGWSGDRSQTQGPPGLMDTIRQNTRRLETLLEQPPQGVEVAGPPGSVPVNRIPPTTQTTGSATGTGGGSTGPTASQQMIPADPSNPLGGYVMGSRSHQDSLFIKNTRSEAISTIDSAIRSLQNAMGREDPLVRDYFGIHFTDPNYQATVGNLISNFQKVKDCFTQKCPILQATYEVRRDPQTGSETVMGGTTLDGVQPYIEILFPASTSQRVGATAPSILVHEGFHATPGLSLASPPTVSSAPATPTTTEHYRTFGGSLTQLPPEERRRNVDNYAAFAYEARRRPNRSTGP